MFSRRKSQPTHSRRRFTGVPSREQIASEASPQTDERRAERGRRGRPCGVPCRPERGHGKPAWATTSVGDHKGRPYTRTARRRGPRRGDPRGRPSRDPRGRPSRDPRGRPSRIQHGFVSFVRGGVPRPCGVPYRPERGHRETGMGDDKRGRPQGSPLRIGGPAPRRSEYEPFKSAAHRCSYATQVSTSEAHKDSSALSTLNLRVSASASVQSARRHLEGISGIRREVPTTRMGRASARLAGAPPGWQPERPVRRCVCLEYARYTCAAAPVRRKRRCPEHSGCH